MILSCLLAGSTTVKSVDLWCRYISFMFLFWTHVCWEGKVFEEGFSQANPCRTQKNMICMNVDRG